MTCVFCDIVQGSEPASVVYSDDLTVAFMDISQFAEGHVLVIPRQHYEDQLAVPGDVAAALGIATSRVARAVDAAFKPAGLTIWQSIRAAGGQDVFHLHWHILPRATGDGLFRFYPKSPGYPPRSRLDELAGKIASHIETQA